jgi:hypothetical protein
MMALLLIAVLFQLAQKRGGTVAADLPAVLVQARCAPAQSSVWTTLDTNGFWEILGTLPSVNGCSATSYAPLQAMVLGTAGWSPLLLHAYKLSAPTRRSRTSSLSL